MNDPKQATTKSPLNTAALGGLNLYWPLLSHDEQRALIAQRMSGDGSSALAGVTSTPGPQCPTPVPAQ